MCESRYYDEGTETVYRYEKNSDGSPAYDGPVYERSYRQVLILFHSKKALEFLPPEVLVIVPPMINFNMGDLAKSPLPWRIRVRQKLYTTNGRLASPKITLTCGSRKNLTLCFRFPARPVYQSALEFIEDFRVYQMEFCAGNFPVYPVLVNETETLKVFNERRYRELAESGPDDSDQMGHNILMLGKAA